MAKLDLCKIALAVENGELSREDLQWICASKEKREHLESIYAVEVSPQKIATILINDWEPIRLRYELDQFDVPAWRVRECINFYVDETVSKKNLIVLFVHYAEEAVERKKIVKNSTVDELAAIIASQIQGSKG